MACFGAENETRARVRGHARPSFVIPSVGSADSSLGERVAHSHLVYIKKAGRIGLLWSGKRDSNSRPRPWQGRALPTELFPHYLKNSTKHWFVSFGIAKIGIIFNSANFSARKVCEKTFYRLSLILPSALCLHNRYCTGTTARNSRSASESLTRL